MYDDAKRWDAELFPNEALVGMLAHVKHAIVWGGNYYELPPSRCWLSWVKTSLMPTMADFELAWTNLDRPSKLIRENRNESLKRGHPTQKPESVMRWCIQQAPDGCAVLDPFMGSGTTLVAAKRLGRKAIGIERERSYCELAVERLRQSALPLEMGA
jgi:site-specific DNA-methyltransferase (adenine-specific)/modification methylase